MAKKCQKRGYPPFGPFFQEGRASPDPVAADFRTSRGVPPPISLFKYLGEGLEIGGRRLGQNRREAGTPPYPILMRANKKLIFFLVSLFEVFVFRRKPFLRMFFGKKICGQFLFFFFCASCGGSG